MEEFEGEAARAVVKEKYKQNVRVSIRRFQLVPKCQTTPCHPFSMISHTIFLIPQSLILLYAGAS